jgi:hypothetical protein
MGEILCRNSSSLLPGGADIVEEESNFGHTETRCKLKRVAVSHYHGRQKGLEGKGTEAANRVHPKFVQLGPSDYVLDL